MKLLKNIILSRLNKFSLSKEQRPVWHTKAQTSRNAPEKQGATREEQKAFIKLEKEKGQQHMKKALKFKTVVENSRGEKALNKKYLNTKGRLPFIYNEGCELIKGLNVSNEFKKLMAASLKKGIIGFANKNRDKFEKEILPKINTADSLKLVLVNGKVNLISTKTNNEATLISIDLKQHSEHFKVLERHEAAKQRIIAGIEKRLSDAKKNVNAHVTLNKLLNSAQANRTIMPIEGQLGVYKINFKNSKGRLDYNLQKTTRIHDVFNLRDLESGNVRIIIQVQDTKGKPYYATYYQNSFYKCDVNGNVIYDKKGNINRAKIFDGTTVSLVRYESARAPAVKPAEALTTQVKERKETEKAREAREAQMSGRKNRLFSEYYDYIMKSDHFRGHKYLQSTKDFEKWFDRSQVISRILSEPPYNLMSPTDQKTYMRRVIGSVWSSEIQGKDFFNEGIELYKGGYKQYIKDYKRLYALKEKGQLTPEQNKQLTTIFNIGVAIARVYEALKTMEPLNARQESPREELSRTVFLNIPEASADEKDQINKAYEQKKGGYDTYPLYELQFGQERQAADIKMIVPANIKAQVMSQYKEGKDLPPDRVRSSDIGAIGLDPVKFMFWAYGFENMVKMGFIKKVDENRYILTKAPKNSSWLSTSLQILKEKGLHPMNSHSWEIIRGELDKSNHTKSVSFIKKIFDSDRTSVQNNLRSNWSRFWHWEWAKTKYVDMSKLNKKTYGRNDFELEAVEKRGFMDMMEKLAKRTGETGMYRIEDKNAAVNLANQYLEHGIRISIVNAGDTAKANEIMEKLKKEFGVYSGFKPFGANKAENEKILQENVANLINKIRIKSLDSSLSPSVIKFIRLGFLEARYIETIQNVDVQDQYFSNDPNIRKAQEALVKQGMALNQMPKVEVDFKAALGALVNSDKKVGVGGGVGVTLKYKNPNGHEVHASIAIAGLQQGVGIGSAIQYAYKKGRMKVFIGAGAGAGWIKDSGWALGGAAYAGTEIDVGKAKDNAIGVIAGAGASLPGGVGVSVGLYWKWDQEKNLQGKIKYEMDKFREIEAISGFNPEKIRRIRNHPNINVQRLVTYLDNTFKNAGGCPDKILYACWERTKDKIINACGRNQELPWAKEFGLAAGIGVSKHGIPGGGGGFYLTFQVPWTQEIVAVRHVVGRFNQFKQEKDAERDLSAQLKKPVHVIEGFELKGENALLYFDSRMGGKGLARVGQVKNSTETKTYPSSSFELIKRVFKDIDIEVRLVGNFVELIPLRIEGSNVEFQLDPDLKSKGLVLDNDSTPQRILLAASALDVLMIARKQIAFPFAHHKGMNLTIITLKTSTERDTGTIRNQSPYYIYKRDGQRYQLVKGESTRDFTKADANVMTLKEYKDRERKGARFEKFENIGAISKQEYQDLSGKMDTALSVKGPEQFSMSQENGKYVANFGASWFAKNRKFFTRLITRETMANAAANRKIIFTKLQKDYAKGKFEGAKPLNDYEMNILYSILIDLSFTAIEKEAGRNKASERQINESLERRNAAFRQYMIRYINEWRTQNAQAWKEVQKAYPEATPEVIANYLFQCMPQDYTQLRSKLTKPQQITENMKFMSFTRKTGGEAVPSVYGISNTNEIQNRFFKVFGPTTLNLNALDARQKAAAQMVLNLLSPLNMKETLTTAQEKMEFLNSDLALSLISLYDKNSGIYPMIEVLGKDNFVRLTAIYKYARQHNIADVNKLLIDPQNAAAFNEFHKLVLGVRNAQLNGEKTYKYKEFTITNDTKVMAGPYLKCANGTIISRQRFAITTSKKLAVPWTGAYAKRNVLVKGVQRKEAAWLTVGLGIWVQKPNQPPSPPTKEATPSDQPPPKDTPSGGKSSSTATDSSV
ncbi:hypothetical protein JW911_02240 [Candidatus Peregrinibacteria bacterium]|nr:hypothetical protein [Candidatus Peregrinibacteria bacterium]